MHVLKALHFAFTLIQGILLHPSHTTGLITYVNVHVSSDFCSIQKKLLVQKNSLKDIKNVPFRKYTLGLQCFHN